LNIITRKQVLNINKAGSRLACPGEEYIIVLSDIKEYYAASLKNRKSMTMIEIIIADKRESLPLFIIIPGKKIIDN
jgi:hypothetical protein